MYLLPDLYYQMYQTYSSSYFLLYVLSANALYYRCLYPFRKKSGSPDFPLLSYSLLSSLLSLLSCSRLLQNYLLLSCSAQPSPLLHKHLQVLPLTEKSIPDL